MAMIDADGVYSFMVTYNDTFEDIFKCVISASTETVIVKIANFAISIIDNYFKNFKVGTLWFWFLLNRISRIILD